MRLHDRLLAYVGPDLDRQGALLAVLEAIGRRYDDATAAAWLFGMNEDLDGEAPIDVLQQGTPDAQNDVVRLANLWAQSQ